MTYYVAIKKGGKYKKGIGLLDQCHEITNSDELADWLDNRLSDFKKDKYIISNDLDPDEALSVNELTDIYEAENSCRIMEMEFPDKNQEEEEK